MNQRIEAAAKAIHKYDTQAALSTTYAPNKHHRFEAEAALAAADAVMFSDEAVERAAINLYLNTTLYPWEAASEPMKQAFRHSARLVIAALKGDEG